MIAEIYKECFKEKNLYDNFLNSLIQEIRLKENTQIVFKKDKGWIFDYENSILFTLTKIASLAICAIQRGKNYNEIVNCISTFYNIQPLIVDSDLQELFSEMFKLDLITVS